MHGMLGPILAAIASSVVLVALTRRLGLPSVLAYLFVGVALGPYALGWLENNQVIGFLGEIGIAFLLFAIGLEFSIPQFLAMRHTLLGLGGLQVAIGTFSGGLIAWWFGAPLAAAFIVGGALALSSTAIVVKQMVDQAELQQRHGTLALGILLFQDLAAVPLLVVIPILANGSQGELATSLSVALVKALLAFSVLLALGRYVLRPLFHEVGSARSSELFTVTVLFVSLFAAWVTEALGLSLALGAFLAGMMLSETEYRHQIEAELRPFKDLLLGLFFITIGMQLDLEGLIDIWPWVGLIILGLLFGKGGIIALLTYFWERNIRLALRTGCVLAHGGEFGFALLALAIGTGLLSIEDAQPILAGIIGSMLIAPVLIRYNGALIDRLMPTPSDRSSADIAEISEVTQDLDGHVVLCGFGRVGQQIANLLDAAGLQYVALDNHAAAVKSAWEDGRRVFFGDATDAGVLRAVGLERARVLVLSFDTEIAAIRTLQHAKAIADVPTLVRTRDEHSYERLMKAGADDVIPETLAASLSLGADILARMDVPVATISDLLARQRENQSLNFEDA